MKKGKQEKEKWGLEIKGTDLINQINLLYKIENN